MTFARRFGAAPELGVGVMLLLLVLGVGTIQPRKNLVRLAQHAALPLIGIGDTLLARARSTWANAMTCA